MNNSAARRLFPVNQTSTNNNDNRTAVRSGVLALPGRRAKKDKTVDPNLTEEEVKALQKTRHLFLACRDIYSLSQIHYFSRGAGSTSFFQNLKTLNLHFNHLKEVNKKYFSSLINLEELDLSSNEIEYLSPNCFENLINLRVLNLSSNVLTTLQPLATASGGSNMNSAARYRVSSLSPSPFSRGGRYGAETSAGSGNNIFSPLVSLEELYLSYNELTDLAPLGSLGDGIPLKVIDVSGNKLEDLEKNFLQYISGKAFAQQSLMEIKVESPFSQFSRNSGSGSTDGVREALPFAFVSENPFCEKSKDAAVGNRPFYVDLLYSTFPSLIFINGCDYGINPLVISEPEKKKNERGNEESANNNDSNNDSINVILSLLNSAKKGGGKSSPFKAGRRKHVEIMVNTSSSSSSFINPAESSSMLSSSSSRSSSVTAEKVAKPKGKENRNCRAASKGKATERITSQQRAGDAEKQDKNDATSTPPSRHINSSPVATISKPANAAAAAAVLSSPSTSGTVVGTPVPAIASAKKGHNNSNIEDSNSRKSSSGSDSMKWKPKKITRGVNTDISIDNGNSDGNEIALDSIRNNSTQSLRLEIDALREENRNLSFEYEKAKEQLLLKVMQNTNEQEKTRVIYEKFFHSENEKTNKIFVLNTQVAALKDELNRRAQEEALRERKLVVLFQHKFKAEVEKYKKQAEEQHRAALLEERSSARLRAEQENAERARQLEGHYKELVNDMRRQQEALEDMARKAEEEMRRTQREEMASLGRIKDNFYSTVQAQQELIVAEQETRYALQRECYYESLLFQVTYLCNSTLSRLARTHLDTEDALRREKDEELRAVERGVEEQVRARVRAELKDKYALYEEALSEREDLIQQLQLQQEELVLERDELLRSTAADAGRRPRGNSRSVEEIEIDMKDTRDIGVNTSFANTNSRSATPPSRNTRHSNNNNNNNTSEGQVSKEKYDGLLRDYQTVKKVMEEQYLSHCRENKTLFDLLKKKEEEIAEEKKAHAAAVTKMKELEDADRRSSSESQTERENLQRTVRNLQSDIERKNSAIADIEAEAVEKLNEKRSRIAELEASVDELQAELARLKRQEDERQEHQREKLSGVGALERRVDELSNQEREYRSAIEAAKQNILMLFSHNKENEKVRESLERALQEKDTQVSKMRSEYEREREEMREKYKKSLDALSQAFMK